ncbi:MAG: hypothetical protein ACR2HA_04465 [Nocardioides sp.]
MPNEPEPRDSSVGTPGSARMTSPGPLMAIGGAEDKLGRRTVLTEFVALAGGPQAKIAVVPTA